MKKDFSQALQKRHIFYLLIENNGQFLSVESWEDEHTYNCELPVIELKEPTDLPDTLLKFVYSFGLAAKGYSEYRSQAQFLYTFVDETPGLVVYDHVLHVWVDETVDHKAMLKEGKSRWSSLEELNDNLWETEHPNLLVRNITRNILRNRLV